MNILVDTHIILWLLMEPSKLQKRERDALQDTHNTVYCSSVSFFEISLKFSLGKLELTGAGPEQLPGIIKDCGFEILESNCDVFASLHQLPRTNHKDPFDRLLAWQAISHNLKFMTHDTSFAEYKAQGLRLV